MIMTHKNARSPHSDITASLQIKNTIIGAAQRWVGSGQNLAIEQQTGIGRQDSNNHYESEKLEKHNWSLKKQSEGKKMYITFSNVGATVKWKL